MKKKILITKEVIRPEYFSCYGGTLFKTPNIDELAEKGTQFNRHYTAAPSTAMSVTTMFSGLFAHQLDRKRYTEVDQFNQSETLFDKFHKEGVATHVIWPSKWVDVVWIYSKVFPKETTVHNMDDITEPIKPVAAKEGPAGLANLKKADKQLAKKTINRLFLEVKEILDKDENSFIWLHMPHALKGTVGYSSDIELVDEFVGLIRTIYKDDEIYVSADHGHMNTNKGIPVYGFHLYEDAIRVPLITPRIGNQESINYPTSHIQLSDIIFEGKCEKIPTIFCDTQYYNQSNRRICLIKDNYKYIYSKRNRCEELFDLDIDPQENFNLLTDKWYDKNRGNKCYPPEEIYFYPHWDKVDGAYKDLKDEFHKIYKEGAKWLEWLYKIDDWRKNYFSEAFHLLIKGNVTSGRFNSKVKKSYYDY